MTGSEQQISIFCCSSYVKILRFQSQIWLPIFFFFLWEDERNLSHHKPVLAPIDLKIFPMQVLIQSLNQNSMWKLLLMSANPPSLYGRLRSHQETSKTAVCVSCCLHFDVTSCWCMQINYVCKLHIYTNDCTFIFM